MNELDRPRTIPDLVEFLRARGERVSRGTLYRMIAEKFLPVARAGRMTSTARLYYQARTPKAARAR